MTQPPSFHLAIPPSAPAPTGAESLSPPRISRRRRAAGLVAVLVLLVPYLLHHFFTRPEYIREQAIRALRDMTGGEVFIGAARLSLFSGITLEDVRILTPDSPEFRAGLMPEDRQVFSASVLELAHDPWRMLVGKLRIRGICASAPEFRVVYDAASNRYNWNLLFQNKPASTARPALPRPRATLRDAHVRVVRLENHQRHESSPYTLDADAWPHPQLAEAFEIDYRVYSDVPHRVRSVFDPKAGQISDTPFLPYATIREALPSSYRLVLDRFNPRGRLRVRNIDYLNTASKGRHGIVEFRDVALSIPLRSDSPAPATSQPIAVASADMTDVDGTVEFAGNKLKLALAGRLNAAACHFDGTIDLPDDLTDSDPLIARWAMDLKIAIDDLELPDAATQQAITSDPHMPGFIRSFFYSYRPAGTVSISADIRRTGGRDAAVEFLGTLTARKASAAYYAFPYRLDDLAGGVRFARDGVYVENLVGHHGAAIVRASGKVDSTHAASGFDLTFESDQIQLNADLDAALSEQNQSLWRHFKPAGTTGIRVRVHRDGSGPGNGLAATHADVDLALADVSFCLDEFPYPLTHVKGGVSIKANRIDFDHVTGRNGDAAVTIDGWCAHPDTEGQQLELAVDARNALIDDALLRALPPAARDAIQRFRAAGRVDVTGTFRQSASREATYDLTAKVADLAFCFDEFPYRVDRAVAVLRLTPERITLVSMDGHHGDAKTHATGTLDPLSDGYTAEVNVTAAGVPLNDDMGQALPAEVRESVWTYVRAGGTADAVSSLYQSQRGGQTERRHRTELTIHDGRLGFRDLPLQMEHVEAKLRIENRRTDILSLTGVVVDAKPASLPAAAPGRTKLAAATLPVLPYVTASGVADANGDAPSVTLTVNATNVPLDNPHWRALLPPATRTTCDAMHLAGCVDLSLDNLSYVRNASHGTWEARGEVILKDAALDAGIKLDAIRGKMTGTIRVAAGDVQEFSVNADLASLRVDRWSLTHATGKLVLPPDRDALQVNDVAATVFGGALTGFGMLRLSSPRRTYGISLTLSEADLGEFFAAQRPAGDGPARSRGKVTGKLSLNGTSGDPRTREGSGEVFLQDAQILTLPVIPNVFAVLNRTTADAVTERAHAQFYVMGTSLRLATADLESPTLSLVGSGTYDLRNDALDLTLVAGNPRMRVPLLTELLEGAAREVIEVRVGGTVASPSVRAEPLRSVKKFLESLLGSSPPSAARGGAIPPTRR